MILRTIRRCAPGLVAMRVLGALLIVSVLAACEVSGEVTVELRDDGSGTVSVLVVFDAAARERLERIGGAPLDRSSFALDDLVSAGWQLAGPVATTDGGVELELVHGFGSPDEVAPLVEQISGDTGLVSDVVVTNDRGRWRETDHVALRADLVDVSSNVAADSALSESLSAAGVDPGSVGSQLDASIPQSLSLTVVARAGDEQDRATARAGEAASAEVTAERFRTDRLLWVCAAVVLGLLGVLALVVFVRSYSSADGEAVE